MCFFPHLDESLWNSDSYVVIFSSGGSSCWLMLFLSPLFIGAYHGPCRGTVSSDAFCNRPRLSQNQSMSSHLKRHKCASIGKLCYICVNGFYHSMKCMDRQEKQENKMTAKKTTQWAMPCQWDSIVSINCPEPWLQRLQLFSASSFIGNLTCQDLTEAATSIRLT